MTKQLFVVILLTLTTYCLGKNMNPGGYAIANEMQGQTYSSNFSEKYFEVYSPPIRTQYSEVYWTMMDEVPLPQELVSQFDGKVMAITGYEADQVFKKESGDESIPIFWQYNHHYMAYLKGKYSKLVQTARQPADVAYGGHGGKHKYQFVTLDTAPDANSSIPVGQFFSEGNGGEFRKSYHGYPNGYAQLIDSPTHFQIQPMQIDTHNRDYNGTGFKPGPLPRASAAPKDAKYSGLLECPCTTRIHKDIHTSYQTQTSGQCSKIPRSAETCFEAAMNLTTVMSNSTTSDTSLPNGCLIIPKEDGVHAVFNNATSAIACGASSTPSKLRVQGTAQALVNLSLDLDSGSDKANITITGPSDVWFGVGFNASVMDDLPYAIIVNGTGGVQERKLGNHDPGQQLDTSVTVLQHSVVKGKRTVVLQRSLKGMTKEHYSFDPATTTNILFINAIGSTPSLSYHKYKGASSISLVAVNAATCICDAGSTGTINGLEFHKNCLGEPQGDLLQQKNPTCFLDTYQGGLRCCHHQWFLLDQDQEIPAPVDEYYLKFRFYYDEYDASKYESLARFYYQTEAWAGEYDITKCPDGTPPEECVQTITARFTVNDMIQPCSPRSDPTCTGQPKQGIELIYVSGHCHAPSCLSMELYDADTGNLICRQTPLWGHSDQVFDEEGYLAIPPCLFSHDDPSLPKPQLLTPETNLMSIKRNNATYTHYGEMASWQMRGVVF